MTHFDFPAGTRLLADCGVHSLDLTLLRDTDLDDTFDARCNDTGETLRINGWLWCFEPVANEPEQLELPLWTAPRGWSFAETSVEG